MDEPSEKQERLRQEGTLHPNPEKVQGEELPPSAFFDPYDLVQMKYEMLRAVRADQRSVADAARIFGLSRVAYYRAREQYQAHGLAGLLPRKRGPKHPHKLGPEVMGFVEEQLVGSSGLPDWEGLSEQIRERFGIQVHPRSIERAVKQKRGPGP
jgi:transposase